MYLIRSYKANVGGSIPSARTNLPFHGVRQRSMTFQLCAKTPRFPHFLSRDPSGRPLTAWHTVGYTPGVCRLPWGIPVLAPAKSGMRLGGWLPMVLIPAHNGSGNIRHRAPRS